MSQEHLRPRTDDPTPEAGEHRWAETPVVVSLTVGEVAAEVCVMSRCLGPQVSGHLFHPSCRRVHDLNASHQIQLFDHRSSRRSGLCPQEAPSLLVTLSDSRDLHFVENCGRKI